MESYRLIVSSLALAALAVLLLALPLLAQWWQRRRAAQTLDAALARHRTMDAGADKAAAKSAGNIAGPTAAAPAQAAAPRPSVAAPAPRWLDTPLGRAMVGDEEIRLLEQCGFHGLRARAAFGVARLLIPLALALLVAGWHLPRSLPGALMLGFGAFSLAFLVGKWLLRRRAAARLRQLADELPVFVDMLRLLQGVGMSIDQSLQLIVTEFGRMLPVLAPELRRANEQFASGRAREQTLQRIGKLFDSEDLRSLILLLTQVDRFGGAVQEPLRAFGLRLQEARKLQLKEKVGRLTVKMTGVMVISLLPVLLIVTAGPGFLGVIRVLGQFAGEMR